MKKLIAQRPVISLRPLWGLPLGEEVLEVFLSASGQAALITRHGDSGLLRLRTDGTSEVRFEAEDLGAVRFEGDHFSFEYKTEGKHVRASQSLKGRTILEEREPDESDTFWLDPVLSRRSGEFMIWSPRQGELPGGPPCAYPYRYHPNKTSEGVMLEYGEALAGPFEEVYSVLITDTDFLHASVRAGKLIKKVCIIPEGKPKLRLVVSR